MWKQSTELRINSGPKCPDPRGHSLIGPYNEPRTLSHGSTETGIKVNDREASLSSAAANQVNLADYRRGKDRYVTSWWDVVTAFVHDVDDDDDAVFTSAVSAEIIIVL